MNTCTESQHLARHPLHCRSCCMSARPGLFGAPMHVTKTTLHQFFWQCVCLAHNSHDLFGLLCVTLCVPVAKKCKGIVEVGDNWVRSCIFTGGFMWNSTCPIHPTFLRGCFSRTPQPDHEAQKSPLVAINTHTTTDVLYDYWLP